MPIVRALRGPARRISDGSRRRKLAALTSWIEPNSTVLLVGASGASGIGTQSLVERGLAAHARVVVALTYEPVAEPVLDLPTVRGDGRLLPFGDRSFDYVVSNAVIEHLGGLAGASDLLMESERVARHGWAHATPNRRFPIEVHTGVPMLHWLPQKLREGAFNMLGRQFPLSRFCLFTGRSLRRIDGPPRVVRRGSGLVPALTLFVASPSFARPQRVLTARPRSA